MSLSADPSCIALYFVDQLAAEQIKVVLSGEGADRILWGLQYLSVNHCSSKRLSEDTLSV